MLIAEQLNISSLKSNQIGEVVSLHQKLLGLTLNNRLGNEHLEYVYETTIKHKSSKVAVATLNEKIVGHIVLSIDPLDLRKTLLKNCSVSKLVRIIFKLLINPSLFYQYLDNRKLEKPIYYEQNIIEPLLAVIAVDEGWQGLGIGSKLIDYAERYFSSNNCFVYKVDTLLSNRVSRLFYSNIGFVELEVRGKNIVLIKLIQR
tara:strand:+ start:171 stop:776 length:606 start_codon:yes stop_codon:yes gene_type:complete